MIARRALGLVAFVLASVTCAPPPVHTTPAGTDVILTKDNAGSNVGLKSGDMLEVRLPENPTTGYRWAVDSVDTRVLQLDTTPYEPATDAGVGGGGTRVFRFSVAGSGSSVLRLKLWREWEGDQSILERFEVTINATVS